MRGTKKKKQTRGITLDERRSSNLGRKYTFAESKSVGMWLVPSHIQGTTRPPLLLGSPFRFVVGNRQWLWSRYLPPYGMPESTRNSYSEEGNEFSRGREHVGIIYYLIYVNMVRPYTVYFDRYRAGKKIWTQRNGRQRVKQPANLQALRPLYASTNFIEHRTPDNRLVSGY